MKKISIFLFLFLTLPTVVFGGEIKPGITVTRDNYQEYLPQLEKLLFHGCYLAVIDGLKRGVLTLPIVKTHEYPQPKYFDAATRRNHHKCKVGKDGALEGWVAGLPFPDPKTPRELAWNTDRREITCDQTTFYCTFRLFDAKGSQERTFRWLYRNYYYTGRVFMKPCPEVAENNGTVRQKESMLILKPFDVKGFSMLRIRYESIYRPDDSYNYIPSIRRVRRLTGSDVTDPVLGSDLMYDDFEYMRQKINPKMTFKMREGNFLVPSISVERVKPFVVGNCLQTTWEIRPLWILEMYPNDPDYVYSKKVMYMERQRKTCVGYGFDAYDQRGRFFRSVNYIINAMVSDTFESNLWHGGRLTNALTNHSTVMPFETKFCDPQNKPEIFSFRYILREMR